MAETNLKKITFKEYPPCNFDQTEFVKYKFGDESSYSDAYKYIQKQKFSPRLIISVYGGNQRTKCDSQERLVKFEESLINFMKKDEIWIITQGTNIAIDKMIGDAVQKYRILHETNSANICLIGMCSWGVIANNSSLEQNSYTYQYCAGQKQVILNNCYDYLIFVDKNNEREYGIESEFRAKFTLHAMKQDLKPKCLQILHNGGETVPQFLLSNLDRNIPLLVFDKTERLANLIAHVINEVKSQNKTLKELIDSMKLLMNKNMLKSSQNPLEQLTSIFEKHIKKITIYDMDSQPWSLEDKITQTIYWRTSKMKPKEIGEMLDRSVRYNSFIFAQDKIFPLTQYIKKNGEDAILDNQLVERVNENFNMVLHKNQYQFVKLFLEFGLRKEYLKKIEVKYEDQTSENGKSKNIKINKVLCKRSNYILTQNDCHKFKNEGLEKSTIEEINRVKEFDRKVCDAEIKDVFLWALYKGYIQIATEALKKFKDPMGSALIAAIISSRYSNASEWFQVIAIRTLHKVHQSSKKDFIEKILLRQRKEWNDKNCIDIALSGNLKIFLNQKPCHDCIDKIWNGKLDIKKIFNPGKNKSDEERSYLRGVLFSNKSGTDDPQAPKKEEIISFLSQSNLTDSSQPNQQSYIFDIPKYKLILYLISHLIFLFLFAWINLSKLSSRDQFSVRNNYLELVVYGYYLSFLFDEILQIAQQDRVGLSLKIKAYLSDGWNKFDVALFLILFVGFMLRFAITDVYFMIARCLYAIFVSLFSFRMLQFSFISKSMGVKVIMIGKLVNIVAGFIGLFFVFILSYGFLAHSLSHSSDGGIRGLINNAIYRPYFQTYGELMLDDFEVPKPCNLTCILQHGTVIIGFGTFLLLANIILINLLIAIFGYSINQIHQQAEELYYFHFVKLVYEFKNKTRLPPPLNILYFIMFIVKWCRKKRSKKQSDTNLDKLISFEMICLEQAMQDMPAFDSEWNCQKLLTPFK